MKHIKYFKQQAKKLFKDYNTKTPYIDQIDRQSYYNYTPKYFDINGILFDYDCDEDNFSLMNAQHVISLMAGFRKWTDLIKASETELELAKELFDNQDLIDIEDWNSYIIRVESDNKITLDPKEKLDIFKLVFLNERSSFENPFGGYRIKRN
ncbi:hypothetical protein [Simkania negevensis]|uniref:Uncharacterized protein n=1 Tax=Simkania negevensis (strain ATCC VR-1471 / DSM 27360 / Z) TaxID=331113 RepID=F8L2Z9_SIMNZ|nr:hypothetical protein [Simkania negevensis]CCB87845.1 putative uncharacterized protein [Simkania negevensis Z]